MVFSFFAGLVALKLLSRLLEKGQWWVFGVYCLFAAGSSLGCICRGCEDRDTYFDSYWAGNVW